MAIKIADLWMTFALSTGLIFFGQSIVLASNQQQSNLGQVLPISATTEIAGQTFDLEVAQTPEQQAIGLMNRTFLPDNRGMLFPLDPTQLAGFWMRDTPIPLDIIFLLNGTVLEVAHNLPPCLTELCPLYYPALDISQGITNLGINNVFLFQSEPVGIEPEITLPENIYLLAADQVIEVRGGRAGELGLLKGESLTVTPVPESSTLTPVPESSSSIGILAFAAYGALWLFKCKQNRQISGVRSALFECKNT